MYIYIYMHIYVYVYVQVLYGTCMHDMQISLVPVCRMKIWTLYMHTFADVEKNTASSAHVYALAKVYTYLNTYIHAYGNSNTHTCM